MPGYFDSLNLIQQVAAAKFVEKTVQAIPDYVDPIQVAIMLHDEVDNDIRNTPFDLAPISCSKGCSACCHMNVDVSMPEAEILQAFVQPEDMELLEKQSHYDFTTWDTQSHEQRKCVFLKNNLCSVYEHRPIACRKYFVASDPKDCDSTEGFDKRVQVAVYHKSELFAAVLLTRYEFGTLPKLLYKLLNN